MSWLSAFSATGRVEPACQLAHLRLRHAAEREPQVAQLLGRRGEQEVALIAIGIDGACHLGTVGAVAALDVVAGRQHVGAELLGGVEQVAELDLLVAGDARDRRLAGSVAFGEAVDDGRSEAALVIEHVVRNAECVGNSARIVDVLAGAATALATGGGAVVVELQGNADNVVPGFAHQRGNDGRIDTTRHGHDDALALSGKCRARRRWECWGTNFRPRLGYRRFQLSVSAARNGAIGLGIIAAPQMPRT